jgi:hypothetical protein
MEHKVICVLAVVLMLAFGSLAQAQAQAQAQEGKTRPLVSH